MRRLLVALLAAGLVAWGGFASFRTGEAPEMAIEPALPGIGPRTPVVVTARAGGRGLAGIEVELEQGERSLVVARREHAAQPAWALWGARTLEDTLRFEVGHQVQELLRPGEATLRVKADRAPTWLLRPEPVVIERTLPVKLAPPPLAVLSSQNYAAQGGAAVVVYRVGEDAVAHGVEAGAWSFAGAPLPESGPEDHFALFGVPFDLAAPEAVRIYAEDELGNRVARPFLDRFFPKPPTEDTIRLDDAFMSRVVPEILARSPELGERGGLLESYLAINGELREKNAARLVELGARSAPRFLWREPFLPLPNAKVMSSFADRRRYEYQGRAVDEQVHLGFDLASTRGAEVPAANAGVVVLAEYFGIYGMSVVLDHGHGLMTLYAHLSTIDVKTGDAVERGQPLGTTGASGLAGGDHLHFTVLVRGLPVSPLEWWDARWIRERVAPKLGAGFGFAG